MQTLIGRSEEQRRLKKYYASEKSEFVALYGRRRVGKTFLVKSLFESDFVFYASGIQDGAAVAQIENFNNEIDNYGGRALKEAANWSEAFENLNDLIAASSKKRKKVVFLDEISWMGTAPSNFLSALDHFWNRWITSRDDVLLIVCGSATSWIIDNIVNNTGGLHNRLTGQIQLAPFSLKECEDYFRDKGIPLPRFQILEAYMVFGGVPYYLELFEADRSLAQNIDRMYFEPGAPLKNEYANLYRALFKNADNYIKVIEALASKRKGLIREEISKKSKIKGGGTLTTVLTDLIHCGFVRDYLAFGKSKRDRLYQLIDPFTFFHLTFSDKQKRFMDNFWIHFNTTPAHSAWSGYAFELACLLHIPQIKTSLGVSGVLTQASSWRSKTADPGAQIDLVIDREDKVINLCEMKFASTEFTIDKAYNAKLRAKRAAFLSETATRKAAHTTLVTTFGVKHNEYGAEVLFQLTMNDLFI
ncbi:MAG: ATP-binding protein [Oscillospiraceae bacterium]|nr:ATP-binding protein [Oscillospiraceae bacterium]